MHQHKVSAVKAAVDLGKARVHLVGGGPHLWPCTWCISLGTIHSSTKSTRLSFLGSCPALFLNRSDRKLGNERLSQDCTRGGEPGACTLGEGVKDTGETALSGDLADQFSKAPLAGRGSGLLLATPSLSAAAAVAKPQTPEEPPLHQRSHQPLPRQQWSAQHPSQGYCRVCGVWTCKPHWQSLIQVSQARPLSPCSADKQHLANMGGCPTRHPPITPWDPAFV